MGIIHTKGRKRVYNLSNVNASVNSVSGSTTETDGESNRKPTYPQP